MPSETTSKAVSSLGADSDYAYYLKHVDDYVSNINPQSLEGIVSKCTERYQNHIDEENDFQPIWGPVADLAKDTPAASPTQDQLVTLLSSIKAKGTLKRKAKDGSGEEECNTWGGKAWTELPMFGAHMRESWDTDSPPRGTPEQWQSTNAFVARLTAADVKDFSLYAIWSIRDTLEMPRATTMRETSGDEAQSKSRTPVSIEELLPAALEWIERCGSKLMKLTQEGHTYGTAPRSPDPSYLGKLATEAGLEKKGFNVERWSFWEKRLEEIASEKNDAGGRDKVAKLAYEGLQRMKALHN